MGGRYDWKISFEAFGELGYSLSRYSLALEFNLKIGPVPLAGDLVEDAVEEVMGTRYNIQFVTIGKEERRKPASPAQPRKKKNDAEDDPLVKKTMEIFNAKVVSVEGK